MESNIIGRDGEKRQLQRLYASSSSEFIAVCGRRRVGKTYLIREYFEGRLSFYASGQSNQPMKKQLRAFCQGFPSGHVRQVPGDWFSAFGLLSSYLEALPSGRKVVFLDELPWFDTAKSDFVASLEYFWNSWASSRHDIVLIVCGSATSWMMGKVINNHGGLHNRLTDRLFLRPFTLAETRAFLDARGFNLSDYDTAVAYMVLGGIPFYLRLLNPELDLCGNIDSLLFSSTGYLRYEMDNLYVSLFKNSADYMIAVEALSEKRMGLTRKEIEAKLGKSSGSGVTAVLSNLEDCGFIRKYACHANGRKISMYQMVDFFTLFYFRFLKPGIGMDQAYWRSIQNTPVFNAWAGLAFELLAVTQIRQVKRALGISGVISEEYAWKSLEPGAQVDLIIDRQDRTANICEIKFSVGPYSIDAEEEMKLRARLAAVRTMSGLARKSLQMTFITSYGIAQGRHSGIVQQEVTLADLMK